MWRTTRNRPSCPTSSECISCLLLLSILTPVGLFSVCSRNRFAFLDMDPINSLAALQNAIAALPPVPPGKTRVFRGQTADYETIVPAAYRNRLERSAIWQVYSRDLLSDITRKAFTGEMDVQEFQNYTIWLDAVAQHYGSGSRYLDVSRSIEPAAWFA